MTQNPDHMSDEDFEKWADAKTAEAMEKIDGEWANEINPIVESVASALKEIDRLYSPTNSSVNLIQ
jgi:hypothetical protein